MYLNHESVYGVFTQTCLPFLVTHFVGFAKTERGIVVSDSVSGNDSRIFCFLSIFRPRTEWMLQSCSNQRIRKSKRLQADSLPWISAEDGEGSKTVGGDDVVPKG